MSTSFLSRLLGARRRPDAPPSDRRAFLRRASGADRLHISSFLPDDAWEEVRARAEAAGITPGTVVDARGRPVEARGAEPFLGEIMMCGWNFAARGWAFCNGQLQSIAENNALFSLLGTIYGGDGRTTFALPDLRGRFPTQFGSGPGLMTHNLGQRAGAESVTQTMAQMPAHQHGVTPQPVANVQATLRSPVGNVPAIDAGTPPIPTHAPPADASGTFGGAATTTGLAGGTQPTPTMPPFLAVNFQIALFGIYPSRS